MRARFITSLFLALLFCAAPAGAAMEEEIIYAGGCFWGVQEYFSRLPGVLESQTGYANSNRKNPTYQEVCSGATNAAEAVRIKFDPEKISLDDLTRRFFMIIDPVSVNRQGNDRGTQYRTGIYYLNKDQLPTLELAYAQEQGKLGEPLAVELMPLENFYPAEDYHQDYLKKNPNGYCHINLNSLAQPRKSVVDEKKYPKPSEAGLKAKLSRNEYAVTQEAMTEPPFSNGYWNNHARGIYVDAATGEPLFSSSDKYDSGTGWPSFTKAIDPDVILGSVDKSHGMTRIEAKSRSGKSHLGHIFPDGPNGGERYCINSAALRFIPYDEMDHEGYGDLKYLVTK